ncbi:hypothetical protein GCM10011491_36730 [Brucella endophytica]|uniref:Bacteriocin-protection protein n=1 Tax=Brucella endophytica TaxID=1963359 RepID=A0A916SKZ2_9HYPH|nr:YdeI/OmpD-associated family protein [Brucella endophytica]GGB05226.1 hypothetical protein GCM10011491_36730 [Brucella endophytica]
MDVNVERVQAFADAAAFCAWLAENHAQQEEVWLKLYKKSSGIPSVSWAEAVVEALAWGWIDGIKKSHDDQSWFQRFTPRKPRSAWSKTNRAHAERLIAEGRMQEPGMKAVAAAKADGRWDAAYSGSAAMEFPESFLAAIGQNAAARETFERLNRSQLFSMYYRLHSAKKEETRQKLMEKMLGSLARGEAFR